jgi:hypothetical protein
MTTNRTQRMEPEERSMLALAALSYRGFASQSETAIARKLDPWLASLETFGLGGWQRVWGPETFRIPTSFVDDAMVYVVREKRPASLPPRYAVAIRGTNPVSLFDWVFGDLWVNQLFPWPGEKSDGAQLSGSTFLGLEIIRRLGGDEEWALPATLGSTARELASGLQRIAFERALSPPERLAEKLEALEAARRHLADRARELLPLRPDPDGATEGTLGSFLASVPRGSTVAVTGHSKGGALALATALWLHENWAPTRGGEIECFSFAGPTAGNAAFARRYEAALGKHTHRIVNPLDLVPHAWARDDLERIAGVYGQLGPPIEVLAKSVAEHGYTHVNGTTLTLPEAPVDGDLHQQIVHQHLDAYLRAAGLPDPPWNTQSIFLGRDRVV